MSGSESSDIAAAEAELARLRAEAEVAEALLKAAQARAALAAAEAAAAAEASVGSAAQKVQTDDADAGVPASVSPPAVSPPEGPLNADEVAAVIAGYTFGAATLDLGALVNGAPIPEAQVRVPLAMLNRHGLVAGATGTGKRRPHRRPNTSHWAASARACRCAPPCRGSVRCC